jgi:hypothetical protein
MFFVDFSEAAVVGQVAWFRIRIVFDDPRPSLSRRRILIFGILIIRKIIGHSSSSFDGIHISAGAR